MKAAQSSHTIEQRDITHATTRKADCAAQRMRLGRICKGVVSGARADRPGLQEALDSFRLDSLLGRALVDILLVFAQMEGIAATFLGKC